MYAIFWKSWDDMYTADEFKTGPQTSNIYIYIFITKTLLQGYTGLLDIVACQFPIIPSTRSCFVLYESKSFCGITKKVRTKSTGTCWENACWKPNSAYFSSGNLESKHVLILVRVVIVSSPILQRSQVQLGVVIDLKVVSLLSTWQEMEALFGWD